MSTSANSTDQPAQQGETMFDNETNTYALSDCLWWDVPVLRRPWWARDDCSGRVGDTERGVLCEEHFNAIPR